MYHDKAAPVRRFSISTLALAGMLAGALTLGGCAASVRTAGNTLSKPQKPLDTMTIVVNDRWQSSQMAGNSGAVSRFVYRISDSIHKTLPAVFNLNGIKTVAVKSSMYANGKVTLGPGHKYILFIQPNSVASRDYIPQTLFMKLTLLDLKTSKAIWTGETAYYDKPMDKIEDAGLPIARSILIALKKENIVDLGDKVVMPDMKSTDAVKQNAKL